MKVGIISFTSAGAGLAERLIPLLQAEHTSLAGRSRGVQAPSLSEVTAAYFKKDAVIFIGACGIAVRAIAPYVQDKRTDPAVLVIDERAQFVIPVLSGHVGGANALGRRIADVLHASLVLTTATDVNGKFAVDVFAKENGLHILDRKQAKQFTAAVLEERECGILFTNQIPEPDKEMPFETTVILMPKNIYLGIGCRKGKESERLADFAGKVLAGHRIPKECIAGIASIDLKREEACIAALSDKWKVPCRFYSGEELAKANGNFTASDFVTEITGVDNVCERSAYLASDGGRCLVPKQAEDGMTIAVYAAKAEWKGLNGEIPYVSQVEEKC